MYKREPTTPTDAKRSLKALEILSGKTVKSKSKVTKRRQQHESEIQTMLFEWANVAREQYPELQLMYHVPNEGKRNIINGYNLKKQGLKSGIPDICLPVARGTYHGLYIELKSDTGRLQDKQKQWINALAEQGYKAVVCYGFDEAKEAIEGYVKLSPS